MEYSLVDLCDDILYKIITTNISLESIKALSRASFAMNMRLQKMSAPIVVPFYGEITTQVYFDLLMRQFAITEVVPKKVPKKAPKKAVLRYVPRKALQTSYLKYYRDLALRWGYFPLVRDFAPLLPAISMEKFEDIICDIPPQSEDAADNRRCISREAKLDFARFFANNVNTGGKRYINANANKSYITIMLAYNLLSGTGNPNVGGKGDIKYDMILSNFNAEEASEMLKGDKSRKTIYGARYGIPSMIDTNERRCYCHAIRVPNNEIKEMYNPDLYIDIYTYLGNRNYVYEHIFKPAMRYASIDVLTEVIANCRHMYEIASIYKYMSHINSDKLKKAFAAFVAINGGIVKIRKVINKAKQNFDFTMLEHLICATNYQYMTEVELETFKKNALKNL